MPIIDARRMLLAFALAACGFGALPAVAAAEATATQSRQCENSGLHPMPGNIPEVRAAVLCLHNRERGERDLPLLQQSRKLRRAARGHSKDMVEQRFFAHDSPSGASMTDRVLRTGYGRDQAWAMGENLAWGGGELATAAEIQRMWMHSPAHRANILRRGFRDIGIGIAIGAPDGSGQPGDATFTTDFGVRR